MNQKLFLVFIFFFSFFFLFWPLKKMKTRNIISFHVASCFENDSCQWIMSNCVAHYSLALNFMVCSTGGSTYRVHGTLISILFCLMCYSFFSWTFSDKWNAVLCSYWECFFTQQNHKTFYFVNVFLIVTMYLLLILNYMTDINVYV